MKKHIRLWIALLLCFALAVSTAAPVAAQEEAVFQDLDEAVAALRTALVAREETIVIRLHWETEDTTVSNLLLSKALEHTGHPKQGDYLYRSLRRCTITPAVQQQEAGYLLSFTYCPVYYTTAQQEAQLDGAVEALLQQLDLWDATDYQKVSAIYDYICQNIVPYDVLEFEYMNGYRLPHSAYSALVLKTALCQGYATLFYRLCLELGVDSRVIAGVPNKDLHAWNIVRLGDLYYNVDTFWDAENVQGGEPYAYFLAGSANFPKHPPAAEYTTEEFIAAYPISQAPYTPVPDWVRGDLNADSLVNADDAVYLLQHLLMPDTFPVAQPVDYNADSLVNEDDAVYLLQHVLMPGLFPLS